MALAPRPLATAVFVCRSVLFLLEAIAVTYAFLAGAYGFSSLIFLKVVLAFALIYNSFRLLYDGVQLFLHEPLPPRRWIMTALVVADWVMLNLIFAAGSASLSVVDFIDNNMKQCPLLPHGTCSRFRASAILTLLAWVFSLPVGIIMVCFHAIWDHHAAAA